MIDGFALKEKPWLRAFFAGGSDRILSRLKIFRRKFLSKHRLAVSSADSTALRRSNPDKILRFLWVWQDSNLSPFPCQGNALAKWATDPNCAWIFIGASTFAKATVDKSMDFRLVPRRLVEGGSSNAIWAKEGATDPSYFYFKTANPNKIIMAIIASQPTV